jgi:hypothetical protein
MKIINNSAAGTNLTNKSSKSVDRKFAMEKARRELRLKMHLAYFTMFVALVVILSPALPFTLLFLGKIQLSYYTISSLTVGTELIGFRLLNRVFKWYDRQ